MLTFYDGGAWVFTFNGSNYTQVGDKLVVNDAMPNSGIGLGISVSLSADGKTAIIGGDQDNNFAGAAWIFTFNGINFVQFGPKLIGAGSIESSLQGFSVCISGDGKTAIIGGIADNKSIGATWIFTFDGNNFVQVAKLVGSESIGMYIEQGWSVSLSDDGKTALIGGPGDNSGIGAAWVYTFNGSNYIQLAKLIGKDATANAYQGTSVSLTPDGKTAIIGGEGDNNQAGAIWIFTFNGANFVQVGNKLTGSGNSGPASQGHAVAISQDAKFIFSGGISDNSGVGAVWIFNTCIYTNPSPNFNFDIWNDTLYLTSTSKGEILTHQWIVSGDHINLMPAIRYRLKKEDLKRGTLDVRLIVTDLNGCKDSVSRIIKIPPQLSGIASSNNSDIFKVYPNPFHDILSIETNISGTFTIYNSLGQVVFKKLVLGSENIELNNISPGVYYYQFVNYNLVVGKKLLKE